MERQDAAFFMLSNAPYLVLVLACSCFGDFLTPFDIFLVSQFPLPRFSTIARSSGKSVCNLAH
jgi:hypothetical protein